MLAALLIVVGVILVLIIRRLFFYVPRPKFPPIGVDKDDPRMLEAYKTAKESIGDFIELYQVKPKDAQVKVPFLTSSGETEFLWAAVQRIDNGMVEVFLLTPPVTHSGKVDRNRTYKLDDLVDWAVVSNGKIKGGYTMRAMFAIAKERLGKLPEALQKEEQKYA